MNTRIAVILLVAMVLAGCGDASAPPEDPAAAELRQLMQERLTAAAGDGASGVLLITHRGRMVVSSGFGYATCNSDIPVSSRHVFMIGSITKELTQLLGYVLEEKGVISFDDTVADFFPGFAGPIGAVTLRQLIDHTGGLPDLIDENGQPVDYTVEYDYERVSRNELISRAEQAALIAPPGTEQSYSNLGYQLLAAIYEVATGDTYPELLRRHIYRAAGMTGTDFWFADADQRLFAEGCRGGGERWGNPVTDSMWGPAGPSWNLIGAGGLLSTAESLGKFFEGIGNGVYFDDPARAESYKQDRMVYSERRQQLVMGAAGSNGIFNAVGIWGDKDRFNLVMITNRADHQAESGMLREIMDLIPPEYFARQ